MMKTLILFALVCLALAYALPGRELPSFDFDPFVIGGSEATPNEFPSQLSLQYLNATGAWRHTCGASLLSPKYALTAAHCVDGRTNLKFRVVAGLHKLSLSAQGTIAAIKTFKIHEKYKQGNGTYPNDIAILTFATEIKMTDKIKAAVLPADSINKFVNESCIISGWGRTDKTDNLPDALQKGTLTVLSNAECQSKVGEASIANGHLCVYDRSKKTSACNGDSGGPTTCKAAGKDTVVGVASWVIALLGNCKPGFPSAYTRVSEYLDWIKINTP
ncbi:hypothetical protein HELRODRAFT_185617 [Helobdella robusta]|uniref:Peptidase S1 domain-containing protein n=1 Tax=Helobdella robusta TaxID=6412 RepID=T1FN17_HELRO|nr:hypothetical protein HELRODRAFT_185617 [Helobdella robusta]ESO03648.1 hypothetical protein HELRODRAFT_185617 [Helobdella robusta]